jgi:hypothetical protein
MFFSPWTRCSWFKLKPTDQASRLLLGYEISLLRCLPRFNNCSHGFGTVSAVVGAGTTMIETHKLKITVTNSRCTHKLTVNSRYTHKLMVHSHSQTRSHSHVLTSLNRDSHWRKKPVNQRFI